MLYGSDRSEASYGDTEIASLEARATRAARAAVVADRVRNSAEVAVHEERSRIGLQLHDTVGAMLFTIGAGMRKLTDAVQDDPELKAQVELIQRQAMEASEVLRDSMRAYDAPPEAIALPIALRADCRAFEERTGTQARLVVLDELPMVHSSRAKALTDAVREALLNVEKHAAADIGARDRVPRRRVHHRRHRRRRPRPAGREARARDRRHERSARADRRKPDGRGQRRRRCHRSSPGAGRAMSDMTDATVAQEHVSILVIDDHPIVLDGVRLLVDTTPWISLLGYARTGRDGIALAEDCQPDVVLLDLRLPDVPGPEMVQAIRRVAPSAKIVLFTAHPDHAGLQPAVAAGAHGFLLKDADRADLVDVIGRVVAGEHPGLEDDDRGARRAAARQAARGGVDPARVRDPAARLHG